MEDKEIPFVIAEKTMQKDVILDPAGFFVIEVTRKGVRVEYYSNVYKEGKIVSGKLEKVFTGSSADALCDTIAKHIPDLRQEHYLYLGRELLRAQHAFEKKEKYVQNGC